MGKFEDKKNNDFKIGKANEIKFIYYCDDIIRIATVEEDMREHWDCEIIIDNRKMKVDVKGLKRENKNDSTLNEKTHWVELKNVNGRDGWLYGKADSFAFEMYNYWLVVDRIELIKLINEKIVREYKKGEFYHLYQRQNRKDEITLVPTSDLEKIAWKKIEKYNKDKYKQS